LYIMIGLIFYLLFNSYINNTIITLALLISLSLALSQNSNSTMQSTVFLQSSLNIMGMFLLILTSTYARVIFGLIKNNTNNNHINIMVGLVISIFMIVFFSYLFCSYNRKNFRLTTLAKIVIVFKFLMICYLLTDTIFELHYSFMYYVTDIWVNFILPVVLGHDYLALSMDTGPRNPAPQGSNPGSQGGNPGHQKIAGVERKYAGVGI